MERPIAGEQRAQSATLGVPYPTKNLSAAGDGGMAITNDAAIATALREIREQGWKERFVSTRIGINSRLDPIQAAILDVKLRSLGGIMR
jgi:dTDP-4-amino-4,6-dideoxygalactose transaminase